VVVTPVALVFVAAVVAWGPAVPVPEPQPPGAAESGSSEEQAATVAPAVGTGEVRPITPAPAAPAPAAAPATIQAPIIARAPLDVRATPALVAAPAAKREPDRPLYKHWLFWTIAGGFFVTTIVVTIIATRPGPQPYTGNAPPYYVPFQ
jgi:hypothetical protein